MSLSLQQLLTMKQTIEVLAGERGDPEKAAIRMIYLKNLQELIGKLKGETTDLQLSLDVLNADLDATQSQLSTLQTNVGFLQSDVDTAQADITGLQGSISTIQTDISNANASLSQINSDIATIQTEIGGLAGLETRFNTLQSDVNAVSIPNATATTIAATPTEAQYNALLADVNALRTALTNLKNAIL